MKNDLLKFFRWFCRKLTYNDLALVVPVLQEVLSGSRKDMELKPSQDRPPHYRQFRVDPTLPLTQPPEPKADFQDWQQLQNEHKQKFGSAFPSCGDDPDRLHLLKNAGANIVMRRCAIFISITEQRHLRFSAKSAKKPHQPINPAAKAKLVTGVRTAAMRSFYGKRTVSARPINARIIDVLSMNAIWLY